MSCKPPQGLPSAPPALNTIGYCEITENYTSIEVYGFLKNTNSEKILEFNVETYDPEECLALADLWEETPSPCTTPPPPTEPETNTSTSPTISTMETITATTTTTETPTNATTNTTTTVDTSDSIETTDPALGNSDGSTNAEIKEYSLYGVVSILGTTVLVGIVLLMAAKLNCRKKRKKFVEDGAEQGEVTSQPNYSDKDKEPVITDTNTDVETTTCITGDLWRKETKGGGATVTDQHQETTRISQLNPDENKVTVYINRTSIDCGKPAANALSREAREIATVTEQQEQEGEGEGEKGDEHSQQGSDLAKVTVITNGGSMDPVDDSTPPPPQQNHVRALPY